jgi:hypothetical protein
MFFGGDAMWYVSDKNETVFRPDRETAPVGCLKRVYPDNANIRGYFRDDEVYVGVNAKKAMEAVERAYLWERKSAK